MHKNKIVSAEQAIALIRDGAPEVSSELSIDYGLPVHLPMVDVRAVGAGGGSIASVNAAGIMQVGPRRPGPSAGPARSRRGRRGPTTAGRGRVPAPHGLCSKNVASSAPATGAATHAPAKPSHVFLGLMRGAIGCRPPRPNVRPET